VRVSGERVATFLDGGEAGLFDVDGDGQVRPLTDGILVMRHLSSFTGNELVDGALGAGASRQEPAVVGAYLDALLPGFASGGAAPAGGDALVSGGEAPAPGEALLAAAWQAWQAQQAEEEEAAAEDQTPLADRLFGV